MRTPLSKPRGAHPVAAVGIVLLVSIAGTAIGLVTAAAPHRAAADSVGAATIGPDGVCSSMSPCLVAKNTGAGPAIHGVARKNTGVNGTTSSNLNSTMTIQGITFGTTAGIAGYDDSTVAGDYNQGVLGFSKDGVGTTGISESADPAGGIGVIGYDLSASNPKSLGVYGYSGADIGVLGDGRTATGIGVFGNAQDGGVGTFGFAQGANGVGLFGVATDSSGQGVSGNAPGGGFGVVGTSTTGNGVGGTSTSSSGVIGQSSTGFGAVGISQSFSGVLAQSSSSSAEALRVVSNGSGPLIRASNSSKEVMSLDNAGNLTVTGSVTQFGTPNLLTRNAQGGRTIMYSPKQSVATVEDAGEGQLVDGQSVVHIDPAFAATMDTRRQYLVFITPQGDTNGLYVIDKTPAGFVVREHDGRSSVAFDYRIVANPYEPGGPRLATWNTPLRHAPPQFASFAIPRGTIHALQRLRSIPEHRVPSEHKP
jgi:hypothetical protein